MQKLVIVFALMMTCSLAAPLNNTVEPAHPLELIRPSPINPDIPSDPKPEEKITLIKDPKFQPLISPTPAKLPGPYVLPREPLLRTKRADKDSSESDEKSSEEKKSSRPLATGLLGKPATKLSTTPVPSTTSHSTEGSTSGVVTSSTSATIPTHPKIPYSPQIHQHNEHLFKRTTEAHSSGSSSTSTSTTVAPSHDHANNKRDIPVPLTPKYHHNDDDETKHKKAPSTSSSAKVPKEEINQERKKDEGHKAEPVASAAVEQHPATVARPRPVAELFAKKPSTE